MPHVKSERSPVRLEGLHQSPQESMLDIPVGNIPTPEGDSPLSDSSLSPSRTDLLELIPPDQEEEIMINLTKQLCEAYRNCKFERTSARHLAELGVLFRRQELYVEAADTLSEILLKYKGWTSLECSLQLQLMECYLATEQYDEAVKTGLSLCVFGKYLPVSTITSIWHACEELSWSIDTLIYPASKIFDCTVTLSTGKVEEGEEIRGSCIIYSSLPCAISLVNRVFVLFKYRALDTNAFEVKSNSLSLHPSTNTIELAGIANKVGVFTASKLYIEIGRINLEILMENVQVIIEESIREVSMHVKVPALQVLNHAQLFIVCISSKNEEVKNAELELKCQNEILCNSNSVEYILSAGEQSRGTLNCTGGTLNLPSIPANAQLYVLLEIIKTGAPSAKSPPNFNLLSSVVSMNSINMNRHSAQEKRTIAYNLTKCRTELELPLNLKFRNKYEEFKEIAYVSELSFIDPLSLTTRVFAIKKVQYLKITIECSSHVPLIILGWNLEGCTVIQDPNLPNIQMQTGEQITLGFVISNIKNGKISIRYRCSFRNKERKLHINQDVDEKIRSQVFTLIEKFESVEYVARLEHTGNSVLGQPYHVTITLNTQSDFDVIIEKSEEWRSESRYSGEHKIDITLLNNFSGTLRLPDIKVQVNGAMVKLEGMRNVYVYPNLVKKSFN